MSLPESTYPGAPLSSTAQHIAGKGTYINHQTNQIHASLSGTPQSTSSPTGSLPTLSVTHSSSNGPSLIPSRQISRHNTLPFVNAIVLARVTRLQQRQANVSILVVDGNVCADEFSGVIRREDVRGWEVDKVVMEEAFCVGDVVRGVVISLGDQSSYYLSTARNELGVLLATSRVGNQMVPVSWKAFRDMATGSEEARKVAKPV